MTAYPEGHGAHSTSSNPKVLVIGHSLVTPRLARGPATSSSSGTTISAVTRSGCATLDSLDFNLATRRRSRAPAPGPDRCQGRPRPGDCAGEGRGQQPSQRTEPDRNWAHPPRQQGSVQAEQRVTTKSLSSKTAQPVHIRDPRLPTYVRISRWRSRIGWNHT